MIRITTSSTYSAGALKQLLPMMTEPSRKRAFSLLGQALKQRARVNARNQSHRSKHPTRRGAGFWASISDSVSFHSSSKQVEVGAAHEAAWIKQHGGTITAPGKGPGAKGAAALTIPISDKSRGYSVGELASRWRIFRIPKTDVLAANINGELTPLYVLRKSVKVKPTPWFPDEQQVREAIAETLRNLS